MQIDSPVGTFSGKGKLGYRTSPFFSLSLSLDFGCFKVGSSGLIIVLSY